MLSVAYGRQILANGGQIDNLKASQRQMQGCTDPDVLSIRLVATVRKPRHRDRVRPKFPRRITPEDQVRAQLDDFREVAAAPGGVEPGAADEPIRVALEVAPFVVIGEACGRDLRPRRQCPQRLHIRLAKRAVYRLEPIVPVFVHKLLSR